MLTYSAMLIDRFLPREHRVLSAVFFASISGAFCKLRKKVVIWYHRVWRRMLSSHVQAPYFNISLRVMSLIGTSGVQRQEHNKEKKMIVKNKCSTSQNIAIAPYENMDKPSYRGLRGDNGMAKNHVKNSGYDLRILLPSICLPIPSTKNNALAQTIFWIGSNPIAIAERCS